jgi:hypothetical protein
MLLLPQILLGEVREPAIEAAGYALVIAGLVLQMISTELAALYALAAA